MTAPKNPAKTTAKAGKLVSRALRVFEQAAFQLEVAAAEHLSASDALAEQSQATYLAAHNLSLAAIKAEDDAYEAQEKADSLRSFLSS